MDFLWEIWDGNMRVNVGLLKVKLRGTAAKSQVILVEEQLVLEPILQPAAIVKPESSIRLVLDNPIPKKYTVSELIKMDGPPKGWTIKTWESRIAAEKLVCLYRIQMKERWNYDVPAVMPMERACFKNFYAYFQDLKLAMDIMVYIIEYWVGLKARYRLHFEEACPRAFAYQTFIKQIAIEFHKKTNVTREDPQYVADFKDEVNHGEYQSDWE
jgi:hypothetical protein